MTRRRPQDHGEGVLRLPHAVVDFNAMEAADAAIVAARRAVAVVASSVVRARGPALARALARLAVAVGREERAVMRRNQVVAEARARARAREAAATPA